MRNILKRTLYLATCVNILLKTMMTCKTISSMITPRKPGLEYSLPKDHLPLLQTRVKNHKHPRKKSSDHGPPPLGPARGRIPHPHPPLQGRHMPQTHHLFQDHLQIQAPTFLTGFSNQIKIGRLTDYMKNY